MYTPDIFIEFCDCFYKEVIIPLTDEYYNEFLNRIKYIAEEHEDETVPKSKKIKLTQDSNIKKLINFIAMKFYKIESNELSFQNKNLVVKYDFDYDKWICWCKDDNEKEFNEKKKANNFLPLVAYLYDYYYNDYYWKVNYDIFIYFNIKFKIEFLQVMFNSSSFEVYDSTMKIYRRVSNYEK